jgi:hypothetical protein
MKRIAIYALVVGLIFPFTQVAQGQQAGPVQPPPLGPVAQSSSGGPSASDVANANNPIAPMNALFFQNYYAPTAYGTPGPNNLLDLRTLMVSGRQIVRATLPISSSGNTNDNQSSGLGDFNVFDAFKLTPQQSRNVFATGPLVVAPTATNSNLEGMAFPASETERHTSPTICTRHKAGLQSRGTAFDKGYSGQSNSILHGEVGAVEPRCFRAVTASPLLEF